MPSLSATRPAGTLAYSPPSTTAAPQPGPAGATVDPALIQRLNERDASTGRWPRDPRANVII